MLRFLMVFYALVMAGSTHAAEPNMQFAGSHPPAPEVLQLIQKYQAASTNFASIEARDNGRKPLISPAYFYLDRNGDPIAFEPIGARHTKNSLSFEEQAFDSIVLHQYENTAIVTYKSHSKGQDKGAPFEDHSAAALVMSRTTDGWRVIADLAGPKIAPPANYVSELSK